MLSRMVSFIVLMLFGFLLAACGGGGSASSGGGNGGTPTSIPSPTAGPTTSPIPTASPTPSASPLPTPSFNPNASKPNILLIIADDMGLDASSQYDVSNDRPSTPTLDSLAASGIVFENAWATPACTTTRGSLITGMHGVNSGVDTVPNLMDTSTNTVQRALRSDNDSSDYVSSVIGKWHIAGPSSNLDHPEQSGVGYFWGNISGTIDNYYDWVITSSGEQSDTTTYHTTAVTDTAINWIDEQSSPWFLWLAYVAPHSPYHLPPQSLQSRGLSGTDDDIQANGRAYYLAAIEAMDAEIGRVLNSMSISERENTLIIFVGDNGTPSNVLDSSVFSQGKAKNTLYEGGVRVPMLVSGAGVTRVGVREMALINTVDFYPSILEAAGAQVVEGLDGESFYELLGSNRINASERTYNYTEFVSNSVSGWAVRNAQYKLIEFAEGSQELYDVLNDLDESDNLIASGVGDYVNLIADLKGYANGIRGITEPLPSDDDALDITNTLFTANNADCSEYVRLYRSEVNDVAENKMHTGSLTVSVDGNECVFVTNAIPNHDFNDGISSFPNTVTAQNDEYRITTSPQKSVSKTALALSVDNALLLNGVKVDLLAAACFGVGNEKVGCNDINQAWRFDPMFTENGFRVDSHNAHTQPDGTYHYHGAPNALFDESSSLVLVGYAADGFPVFGSYFYDGNSVRKATSSFRVREGTRPIESGSPGGSYDGTYRDDYEFVEGAGDLDECNGMDVDGVYGYFITDDYPYVLACFSGTPHSSFNKQ